MDIQSQSGRVTIRCVANVCTSSCFYVTVFDSNNIVIFQGYTDCFGLIRFSICVCDEYRIKVENFDHLSPGASNKWVDLNPSRNYGLYFYFKSPVLRQTPTTRVFSLNDRYYGGLPISKGDIFLWQHHM